MSTGRHASDEDWWGGAEPFGPTRPQRDGREQRVDACDDEAFDEALDETACDEPACDDPTCGAGAAVEDDDADDESAAEAWDAHDERRRKDCFAPPQEPCECYCLHCNRVFMSDGIWFQRVIGDPMGVDGFWMCPTPNCDGAGFTFDIFPTDPDHPANEGWCYDDGDEDEEGELDGDGPDAEWDPEESKYRELDEAFGESGGDDDIEGEEWKYGLEPGERPAEPDWMEQARREREEEEKRYDEPDQRPRILDWSHREDRKPREPQGPGNSSSAGDLDDDIPF